MRIGVTNPLATLITSAIAGGTLYIGTLVWRKPRAFLDIMSVISDFRLRGLRKQPVAAV